MKKIICVLFVALSLFSLFACSCDKNKGTTVETPDNSDAYKDYIFDENYVYDGHSLVGKWQEKIYSNQSFVSYEFFADGSFEQVAYQYGIEFSRSVGTYTVDKNKLVVAFPKYDGSNEYVENRFNITPQGEILMLYLDLNNQMVEKKMVLIPYSIERSENTSLVQGTWEYKGQEGFNGEYWSFKEDLTGTITGNGYIYYFHYTIHNGKLYIANELIPGIMNDLVEYSFKVEGNNLTISSRINGNNISLSFERR